MFWHVFLTMSPIFSFFNKPIHKNETKKDIYLFSIRRRTRITKIKTVVMGMPNLTHNTKKHTGNSCASCGKIFDKNEMKVSYDFEQFYCFSCDDNK